MRGILLDFSVRENAGIISSDDGRRYSFAGSEWKDKEFPVKGMAVDFEIKDDNAFSIFGMSSTPAAKLAISSEQKGLTSYEGFYKSTDEKILGGVCGGLAHKWQVSVTGLRIVFLIFAFWAIGLLLYVGLWIILKSLPTRNIKVGSFVGEQDPAAILARSARHMRK